MDRPPAGPRPGGLPNTDEASRIMAVLASRSGVLVRIWRRKVLFASVFAVVFGAALLALAVLPTRYVAAGAVIVAEQEPGTDRTSAAWAQKIGDPADLESQLLLVRSPRTLRLAMAYPGVLDAARKECQASAGGLLNTLLRRNGEACDKLQPESTALLEHIEPRYTVGTVGRSRVINISYQSPLPDVAQTMANALVTVFLDDQRETMAKSREVAATWLWREVKQLDTALREEDAKIQSFRRAKGLMRGSTAPITSERLTSIGQQLSAAEAAQAEAGARLQEILSDKARGSINAPAVMASRAIGDLKQQMTTITAQLANASTVLGPNHPSIQALQRERESLQARLSREVDSIVASSRKIYDGASALVVSLKRQMETQKADVGSATDAEAQVANMLRNVEIKRAQYVDLYKRASELETERRVLIGSTRLVSLAELPAKPFFPKPLPFLAAGLTLASLLAAAAALLRDRADGSVRAGSNLARQTGIPILAQLPQVRQGSSNPVSALFRGHGTDLPLRLALRQGAADPGLQDGLRTLFARLSLAGGREGGQKILVTSTGPREGKTFTTLALASLVAASGRRVLAIECDMRCPSFHEVLDLGPQFADGGGLGAVLRGSILPREAVVPTGTPNLDAIPAGPAIADSTELLMGDHMADLLRWAAKYDLVLIDSPPAGLLMDACVLAKLADGVLCCARWGRSQVAATEATLAALQESGGQILGMAVTMVEPDTYPLYESRAVPAATYIGVGAA